MHRDVKASTAIVSRLLILLCLLCSLGGCATFYVDSALKDARIEAGKQFPTPHPVQLLFNFQTKGTNNARATDFLRKHVEKTVADSHLFSEITTSPVSSGALLTITLNNVPITSESDAAAKGFATGFTFGLVGSAVSDGYTCTIEYYPVSGDTKLQATSQHMIHTTMGAKSAPKTGIKAKSIDQAVTTMAIQIVTSALDKLSSDPNFK